MADEYMDRDAFNMPLGGGDLDAAGNWVPPRSQIEERQRVIRDLRPGYAIVPKVHIELIRQGLADGEIWSTAPISRALRKIVEELDRA